MEKVYFLVILMRYGRPRFCYHPKVKDNGFCFECHEYIGTESKPPIYRRANETHKKQHMGQTGKLERYQKYVR
jgi:hypothetical protein